MKIVPFSVLVAGAFYIILAFFMLSLYLIILYHFVLSQHFLRCHISFFNTGDLIAKAHINSLKGVRRNSQVTWETATKLAFSLEFLHGAKQTVPASGSDGVSRKPVRNELDTRNICFPLKRHWEIWT